jgi:hypothetical protein
MLTASLFIGLGIAMAAAMVRFGDRLTAETPRPPCC